MQRSLVSILANPDTTKRVGMSRSLFRLLFRSQNPASEWDSEKRNLEAELIPTVITLRCSVKLVGIALAAWTLCFEASGQVSSFPYTQNFDSGAPPALPEGWTSTQSKIPGTNDFATSSTTPRSLPNAALATNATVVQSLISPLIDFSGHIPDRMTFYMRRSASFNAYIIVEASIDSGNSYMFQIGDTLTMSGATNYILSTYTLPSFLSSSRETKFRWRVIPDTSGINGTLRIDDVSITVRYLNDLALGAILLSPASPLETSSLKAMVRIKNLGSQTAQHFSINFYLDTNRDSIAQPSESIASGMNLFPLGASDSADLTVSLGQFPPADGLLIGKIDYPPDQNPMNDQSFVRFRVGYRRGSIVINEIMYAPGSPEPEWVELYNTRGDSLDLKDWSISDGVVTARHIIAPGRAVIPPKGYVVLTRDSAALIDAHPDIESRVVNVGGFPTLNNSGDAVVLYDRGGTTMDSVRYLPVWGGSSGGRSLERIDPLGESTLQLNWGTSRHLSGSSPASRNSITRKDLDLSLDTVTILPRFPVVGESLLLVAKTRNIGTHRGGPFTVSFYEDANGDSVPQPGELLGSVFADKPLVPLDTLDISYTMAMPRAGMHVIIANLWFAGDEDTTNNRQMGLVNVGYLAGTLRINEIMYAPPAGIPEWVELLNASQDTVDVMNWKVGNRIWSSRYGISNATILVPPSGLVVIAKDTALLKQAYMAMPGIILQVPSLPTFLWTNSGDAVVLRDNRGVVVDSLFYRPSWGGSSGSSLERIDALAATNDSTNWASSQDVLRATPGRRNSVVALNYDLRAVAVSAALTAPGSPASLIITVQNVGKMTSGTFRVLLYDDLNGDSVGSPGELVEQVTIAQPIAPRDSLVVPMQWAHPAPGIHLALAVLDYPEDLRVSNNTFIVAVKVAFAERTMVINEIMFAPFPGDAEYVELMNTCEHGVDVDQWKISDLPTPGGSFSQFLLSSTPRMLQPGELLVIASDSSAFARFPYLRTVDGRRIIILNKSSMNLNNDGDVMVLRDASGWTVDSVAYVPSWHNPAVTDRTGRSLERIQPLGASNDFRNWSTCVSPAGGSPGMQNSIYTSSFPSQSRLSLSPNPFSPDADGMDDFMIIHYEVPIQTFIINIKIFDIKGRLIRRLANNQPSGARGDVVWDGRDDERLKARIGIYVVFLEAIDDRGGVVVTAKGAVVLAGTL